MVREKKRRASIARRAALSRIEGFSGFGLLQLPRGNGHQKYDKNRGAQTTRTKGVQFEFGIANLCGVSRMLWHPPSST